LILLLYLGESTTTPQWIGLSLVSGLGCGILYPAISIAVQAAATTTDLPFAAAMFSFFRSLGQTFGIAVGGMIFQNAFKQKLKASGTELLEAHAEEWAIDAGALVEVVKNMMETGQDLVRMQLVGIYVDSLRVIWIVMCVLAGISLVGSLIFTKEISLKRE
jgi:MFS family permease